MTSCHTTETPSLGDIDNGSAITTSDHYTFDAAGTVTAIRFWCPSTNTGTYTVGLYQQTAADTPGPGAGTLLAFASVLAAGVTPDTWNNVTITSQAVSSGNVYVAACHRSSGRYVATPGAFTSAGISNGGINALQSGATAGPGIILDGTFDISATLAYPASNFGQPDYFVDVVYTASGGARVPDLMPFFR